MRSTFPGTFSARGNRMELPKWIRVGALAAIFAGILRGVASFVPESISGIRMLYFLIDILLLFAMVGLCRFRRRSEVIVSQLGFVLIFIALTILIARDVGLAPVNAYAAGALIFSIGLVLFAIDAFRSGLFSRWIPTLWILSTIVGPLGYFLPEWRFLFALSGLTFGIAFAAAGVEMWRWQHSG